MESPGSSPLCLLHRRAGNLIRICGMPEKASLGGKTLERGIPSSKIIDLVSVKGKLPCIELNNESSHRELVRHNKQTTYCHLNQEGIYHQRNSQLILRSCRLLT